MVYAHELFSPVLGLGRRRVEASNNPTAAQRGRRVGFRNQGVHDYLGVRVDGNGRGISDIGTIDPRADITEVPERGIPAGVLAALGQRRNSLVEGLTRHQVATPFFGKEEESFLFLAVVVARNENRTTDSVAVVMFLELGRWLNLVFEEVARIECIISSKVVNIPVELGGSRFCFHLDRAGSVAAILRPVVRGEDLDLGNRVNAGINVQRTIAAVIHVVAAIDLPVVVLGAATVEAEGNATIDADLAFVLPRLVADAGDNRRELRKIAPVQLELGDLRSGNGAGEVRRRGFHLSDALAGDGDFLVDRTDGKLHINARFLGYIQHYFQRRVFLKSFRSDGQVIGATGESGNDIGAVCICRSSSSQAAAQIVNDDFSARDGCAGLVGDGATDVAGVLCA